MTNIQIEKYIHGISKEIPSEYPEKKTLLQSLKNSINSFTEDNPDSTLDDLYNHFGTEKEVASSFLTELDPDALDALIQKKKRHNSILIVVLVCVVFIAGATIWYYMQNHAVGIIETITVYEEEPYAE